MKIATSKIKPDQNQPRKTFNELDGLEKTIRGQGILYPILIDNNNVIIDGERRWRVAQKIGLKEVPVRVIDLKDKRREILQLISDIQHEKLPIEEKAMAVKKLKDKTGMTLLEIGNVVGREECTISDWIEIAEYQPIVTGGNTSNYRPKGSAILETRGLPDDIRSKAIEKIVDEGIEGSDEKMRSLVRKLREAKTPEARNEILGMPITSYVKQADRVLEAIKVIRKDLTRGLMLKLPKIQAGLLSMGISELIKHLKFYGAEDIEEVK